MTQDLTNITINYGLYSVEQDSEALELSLVTIMDDLISINDKDRDSWAEGKGFLVSTFQSPSPSFNF